MAKKPTANSIEALQAEIDRISHPAARPFSLLVGKDWDAFLADVRDKGQLHPIVLDADGRILDGRNRWLACKVLDREPLIEKRSCTGAAAVADVISANIRRRHDDPGVRAIQTAKLMELAASQGPENFPALTQAAAAEAAGISDHTLRDAQGLLKQAPDIAAEVGKKNISLHAGRRLNKLPNVERNLALKQVQLAGNKTAAKALLRTATSSQRSSPRVSPKAASPILDTTAAASPEEHQPSNNYHPDYAPLFEELGRLPQMLADHPLSIERLEGLTKELANAISVVAKARSSQLNAAQDELATSAVA